MERVRGVYMSLEKEITLPNGVTLYYWRIVSLTTVVNQQSIIEVAGYISKDMRDAESAALAEARETGNYPETNVYIETQFVNVEYDPEMSVVKAYEMLKGTEEFDGATDVIEEWKPGLSYHVGDTVDYEGDTYECLQSHESQEGWEPNVAVSLWKKVGTPGEIPEWVQPTGAHDAYAKGDHVMHNGKEWVSAIDANTYEPGVYGWDEA